MQPPNRDFSSHILKSILITLFCCQLLGIIAVVYSILAMINNSRGDYETADARAKTANTLCNASLIIAVIIYVASMLINGCSAFARINIPESEEPAPNVRIKL